VTARYPAPTVTTDRQQESSGLSISTLIIASLSSLAAALLVSRIWGGGTLIGAAATPVIVALVSEGLHRPARAVTTVRSSRAARFDPVAEGRRGMREGDLAEARPTAHSRAADSGAAAAGERRVHRPGRAPRGRERTPLRLPRRRVLLAMATGLVAFALAGVLLTGTELVFGDSSVATSSKRTTFFGGSGSGAKAEDAKDEEQTTPEETTTTTTTPTTTEPAPEATTPTEPVPPATEATPDSGGAVPTTPAAPPQTDPGGTQAPAPAAPPPSTP
jgi:hypothetical protein